jgi:DNA-binding MarR family transcriptional regulator
MRAVESFTDVIMAAVGGLGTLWEGCMSRAAPSPAPGRDRDITLLYLIKQVELAVRQALDDVVATADLTSLQYTALTVLERHPGITSAELARNSFVRAQTMAEMITYLLGRGLVTRERDERNRKQYLLSLSPDGQRTLDELHDAVADIESRMLEGFDLGQTEILRTYLVRCRRALSGDTPR